MSTPRAFTLIELLIVVAIIAILAAIAVPNFLEAQVRAKVSRARSDMRSLATALEAYRVDNNTYPLGVVDAPIAPSYSPSLIRRSVFALITTPVAYITSFPPDAFNGDYRSNPTTDILGLRKFYDYRRTRFGTTSGGRTTIFESATGLGIGIGQRFDSWLLYSPGPDQEQNLNTQRGGQNSFDVAGFGDPIGDWPFYDPTNGSVSVGDVVRAREGEGESLVAR
ncbi:MAG: prepilin-type N-terminal cleavage/methylation domain-containing protein [Candidatus Sumerlaeia bacterium]|nr:prepilin-type N-terminal cleavage/methylation domain-containing protein [Candidatus Sumerlaeia bacterium]